MPITSIIFLTVDSLSFNFSFNHLLSDRESLDVSLLWLISTLKRELGIFSFGLLACPWIFLASPMFIFLMDHPSHGFFVLLVLVGSNPQEGENYFLANHPWED